MSDDDKIVVALWDVFRDEIASGEPVAFCFSQETIKEHLAAAGLSTESPISEINALARKCFEIEGDRVSLRPAALVRGASGFSKAIVLVCQEVLAVEEMVREGSGYTENAYFPRLRALMAAELPTLPVNPFRFEEFEAIWRTFAREVHAIPGASDDTITFQFGQYTGVNKARWFPLSQALLSKSDLNELIAHCRWNHLRSGTARDIWAEIRRERNHLSRRGQRLVSSGFLRERLVEQVRSYSARVSPAPGGSSIPPRKPEQLFVAVALDTRDWFSEEYVACLITPGTARRVDKPAVLRDRLRGILGEHSFVLLALDEFGDHWVFREGSVSVGPGNTLLVIGSDTGMNHARAVLDGLSPPISMPEARIRPLGGAAGVKVCPVNLPSNLTTVLAIRSGRLNRDGATPVAAPYTWIGGVCLDARSQKYLRLALPGGILFRSQAVDLNSVTRVNGLSMSWESLCRAIERLESDASYELDFSEGRVARLTVAVDSKTATERMGFLLDESGMLSPTLERLGDSDVAVVGYSESGRPVRKPAGIAALARLLRDLRRTREVALPPQDVDKTIEGVEASRAPTAVKVVISTLLRRRSPLAVPGDR